MILEQFYDMLDHVAKVNSVLFFQSILIVLVNVNENCSFKFGIAPIHLFIVFWKEARVLELVDG